MSYFAEFEQARSVKRQELREAALRVKRFNAELASLLQTFSNDGLLGLGASAFTENTAMNGGDVELIVAGRAVRVSCLVREAFAARGLTIVLRLSLSREKDRIDFPWSRSVSLNEDGDVMVALVETMRLLGEGAAMAEVMPMPDVHDPYP